MALTKIPGSLLDTASGINGLIYPTSDGTSGQFLKTDGSGNLTFATVTTYTDSDVETYLDGGTSTPTFATATVSGTLTVTGDLDITGDINSYNVTDLDVTDKTITLGAGQTEANSGSSGIIVDGSNASLLWDETNDEWDFNKSINVTGTVTADGLTVDDVISIDTSTGAAFSSTGNLKIDIDSDDSQTDRTFQITSDGNSKTLFQAEEGGDISFYEDTGTTAKFFWDASAESLGIGTTSPSQALEVTGITLSDGYRTAADNTNYSLFTRNSTNTAVYIQQAGSGNILDVQSGSAGAGQGTSRLLVKSDGNVGIGTTSPSEMLHINNTIGTGCFIRFQNTGGSGVYIGGRSEVMEMYTNGSEKMRIDSSGNVGIGTNNPSAKLNTNLAIEGSILAYMSGTSTTFDGDANIAVAHSSSALGTGTAAGLLLANNNNSNGAPSPLIAFSAKSALGNHNHTYATMHGEKSSSGADNNWNTGALIFSTSSGTGPNERMRINNDGDLLLGTIAAVYTGTERMSLKANSTGAGLGIQCITAASQCLGLFNSDAGGTRHFIRFAGGSGGPQVGSVTNVSSTTSYNTTSDYRLKENITYEFNALERLAQLKPARFNFIADGTDRVVDGFIAHEVSDIVPEAVAGEKDAVKDDGTIDPQGMDASKLVPLLTKAIQELSTKLEAAEARITELEG